MSGKRSRPYLAIAGVRIQAVRKADDEVLLKAMQTAADELRRCREAKILELFRKAVDD